MSNKYTSPFGYFVGNKRWQRTNSVKETIILVTSRWWCRIDSNKYGLS